MASYKLTPQSIGILTGNSNKANSLKLMNCIGFCNGVYLAEELVAKDFSKPVPVATQSFSAETGICPRDM
jgi:hypothetical protein